MDDFSMRRFLPAPVAARRRCFALLCFGMVTVAVHAQAGAQHAQHAQADAQMVIIDTDIGDDLDDVFAVGLALVSPEVHVIGITTAWGDTALKGRLVDRLLAETGRTDIPVAVGIETHPAGGAPLSQAKWAERQPLREHSKAVDFLLEQIRQHPGEITLIGIGPLTNLGAAIARDPATFRKLKRIVIMGGSVRRGYNDFGYLPSHGPDPEYNIVSDIAAAQAVFGSGVPLYVMPLDSTQIKLDETRRQLLFSQSTPLTDAMALLYVQWSIGHSQTEPTLFDAVAVAYAIDPAQCPVTPMRLEVDAKGYTRETPGAPNTFVCLRSNEDTFFDFYMPRLLGQRLGSTR
jgi:inosine-uridine nucleoside N-ribohydrolase